MVDTLAPVKVEKPEAGATRAIAIREEVFILIGCWVVMCELYENGRILAEMLDSFTKDAE